MNEDEVYAKLGYMRRIQVRAGHLIFIISLFVAAPYQGCGAALRARPLDLSRSAEVIDPADNPDNPDDPTDPGLTLKDVNFDMATLHKYGLGSDNWAMTWEQEGSLVGVWGDGWGLSNVGSGPKISLGVSRISGDPGNLSFEDIFQGDPQGRPIEEYDGK